MRQQPVLHLNHVSNCNGREITAIGFAGGRINTPGAGGPTATAQQIGADDEEAASVNRLARPNRDVPPARIVLLVVLGDVGVAANGMADQNRVVARGIQLAISLVSHGDRGQMAAQLQLERLIQFRRLGIPQQLGAAHAVTALEYVLVLAHCETSLLIARRSQSETKSSISRRVWPAGQTRPACRIARPRQGG